MDTQTTEVTFLQEQLAERSAELSQLSAKHVKLVEEFGRVELQSAAGPTASDDLKTVAGTCERPAKCAKMTRQCKVSSTASSTAVFLALLAERDDFKIAVKSWLSRNSALPP